MNPVQSSSDKALILYDADSVVQADSRFFEPAFWQGQGALIGTAMGRGTTFFVRDGANEWVVRHYRRGGLVARLLGDRYLWQGVEASRAWREWRLLAELRAAGLPVPEPVAARVVRSGLFYRADIVTRRIAGGVPLSQRLRQGALPAPLWRLIGAMLRRFHEAGVWHADLNAHNILLDGSDRPWLIDFDRGERGTLGVARAQGNLARLRRSLDKLKGFHQVFAFSGEEWRALLAGYEESVVPQSGSSA